MVYLFDLNYKFFTIIGFFLIFPSLVLSQNQGISITRIGYGETVKDVFFVIRNTGLVTLHNMTLYIDGKPIEPIEGTIESGFGFEEKLYLDSGNHLIEVKALEGAYDSINITIPNIRERMSIDNQPPIDQSPLQENVSFFEKNRIYIGIVILILIFLITIRLLLRKPKM